jgi:hypothetical protein
MKNPISRLLFIGLGFSCVTAQAHHSDAGMDEKVVISFEGKVSEFLWRQPHVYLSVETLDSGEAVVWDLQLAGINSLTRGRGWDAETFKPGDEVFVRLNPAVNGKPYGKLSSVERLDGTPLPTRPGQAPIARVPADTLDGYWLADRTRTGPSYPGGFDGFFYAHLVTTEAGKAAQDAYDPLSAENPESTCVGRPTPSAFVSTSGYLMEFDLDDADERIVINSEWYNEQRIVYMDGRNHLKPAKTFATGHSIGYWEDDTLVVDTRNFDDHRSPYQIGIPSGSKKHVVEKYRLIEDGTAMAAEFMLEDPEFLAEPMHHSRVLLHSPHLKMLGTDCDLASTTRLLKLGG